MHRAPANTTADKKSFTHNAQKVHHKNLMAKPMRGGFRL